MIIREATSDDVEGIAHVAMSSYTDAFGQYMSDETLAEEMENRSASYFQKVFDEDTILVAVIDEKIVGYLQFGEASYDFATFTEKDITLRRLYVLTDMHRQGAGQQLIETMLIHPKLVGVENIYLEVWPDNTSAVTLYQKYGFEKTGHIREYLDQSVITGYDEVMVKKLS